MMNTRKILLTTAVGASVVLLAYLFIQGDRQQQRHAGTTTDSTAEIPQKEVAARDSEQSTAKLHAQMKDRYGEMYAVHEMDPKDVGEGMLLHLGLYLVKGETRKELGVTSLGPESYRDKSVLAVAVADGKAIIERWGAAGYTGNAWPLTDQTWRECRALNWSSERPLIKLREEGHTHSLGTTSGGWNLIIEFWKSAPKMQDA